MSSNPLPARKASLRSHSSSASTMPTGMPTNVITEENFALMFKQVLQDADILSALQQAICGPILTRLADFEKRATADEQKLRVRDAEIVSLKQQNAVFERKLDDIEQQGRKGSVRILGIPESTPGQLEDKVLKVCHEKLELPDLTSDDIEVVHRVGRPPAAGEQPARPRAVLLKFTNRRVKARVMKERRKLKGTDLLVVDDLTQRRSHLAYVARKLQKKKIVEETFTANGKIFCKMGGVIKEVRELSDMPPLPPD